MHSIMGAGAWQGKLRELERSRACTGIMKVSPNMNTEHGD
jgi:hypothetical protein